MKSKRGEKPLLFVIPSVLLMLGGFGIMVFYSLGERLGATTSTLLPFAAALAAAGAMLLTRTLLSVSFLFIFSLTVLAFGIRDYGLFSPITPIFVLLACLCIPMAKWARR